MAVKRLCDSGHGSAAVVHADLRNVHLDEVLNNQRDTAVFHRFPRIVVRVEPGADNAEEESCISFVSAGGCQLPDLRIHISAGLLNIRELRQ